MKPTRQAKILELIENKDIETQEQLLAELVACGFATTQATISRDIKELRIIKELSPRGAYRYSTGPKKTEHTNHMAKLNSIFQQCLLHCDYAQNIVVVKTMPGLASAACSALDAMEIEELVGTLAGDDTAFLLLRDNGAAAALCAELKEQLNS